MKRAGRGGVLHVPTNVFGIADSMKNFTLLLVFLFSSCFWFSFIFLLIQQKKEITRVQ